jgi:small subunit ribosomal protein S20
MAQEQAGQKKEKEKVKTKRPTPLKRDMQNAKRKARNRVVKSRVHTAIRNYEDALKSGEAAESKSRLNAAHSVLDKAAQKGVLKKNTVSRTKARLHARLPS